MLCTKYIIVFTKLVSNMSHRFGDYIFFLFTLKYFMGKCIQ